METLREKIISLELSNAEDVESVSDAGSESEDTAGQNIAVSTAEEKTDSHTTTDAIEVTSAKTDASIIVVSTKKKKRKRSKKGRHWQKMCILKNRYETLMLYISEYIYIYITTFVLLQYSTITRKLCVFNIAYNYIHLYYINELYMHIRAHMCIFESEIDHF